MNRRIYFFSLVFLSVVWAGHLVLINVISKSLPVNMTGFCVRAGTLIILTFALAVSARFSKLRIKQPAVLGLLLCVGILGFLLDFFSFLGLKNADSNIGTALLKTDVIFSALLSTFVFKNGPRFHVFDWLIILCMLFGVFLILDVNLIETNWTSTNMFFILSALCVTLNAFLIQYIQSKYHLPNYVIAYYNNLFTMVFFAIFAFFFERENMFISRFSLHVLILVVTAGVTQSLIYLFYYQGLSIFPVWFVKSILLLMPVFSMLINFIVFQIVPSIKHLIGTTIVVGCAAYMLYMHRNVEKNNCGIQAKD